MDAKLEIEVLFKLVESLEKTLIAYNLSNNSGWVCGARKVINELKLAYRDWANSGLSEVLEKRLARSMRGDVCHLLYHMSQVFNKLARNSPPSRWGGSQCNYRSEGDRRL